jgi:hypothetical protein
VVVGRGGSDLGDSAAEYHRNIAGIDLQVELPALAEEGEVRKAGNRLVGVERRVSCARKPLERCVLCTGGGELVTESLSNSWSVS